MPKFPKAYKPIEYQVILGSNRGKGSANSISEALGKTVNAVQKMLYRGTMKSLENNADIVVEAIAQYAKEWLINADMVAVGPGIGSKDIRVGVWTGSFLTALKLMNPKTTAHGGYISGVIGITYDKSMPREEQTDGIVPDRMYTRGRREARRQEVVGDYGEWLMSKLARYASNKRLHRDVEPLFREFVENLLNKFKTDYKVSRWPANGALTKIYAKSSELFDKNRELITQAALIRADTERRKKEKEHGVF